MVSSGSYTFNPTIDDIVTDAYERCGIEGDAISAQMWNSAIFSLNATIAETTNMQLNLWEVEPIIISLNANVRSYQLPEGTVDLLSCYRRSYTRPTASSYASSAGGTAANAFDGNVNTSCTQTSANGNISCTFAASVPITMVGYQSNGTATLNLVYEASTNGTDWVTICAPGSVSYVDSQIAWLVVRTPGLYKYYRVRETGGATLNAREVYFCNNEKDYVLGRLSRQNYEVISTKNQAGTPTAFYVARDINPIVNFYQTPDSMWTMIYAMRIRQVQVAGNATKTLDAPFRFIEMITAMLAVKLALKRAPERVDRLAKAAEVSVNLAQTEDRERVEMSIMPNLNGYRVR